MTNLNLNLTFIFTWLIIVMSFAQTDNNSMAVLDQRISLNVSNVKVKDVLGNLSKQTNVRFSYSSANVPVTQLVSLRVENERLGDVLNDLSKRLDIQYKVSKHQIVLASTSQKSVGKSEMMPNINVAPQKVERSFLEQSLTVSGKVTDPSGEGLPGVSIQVKGSQNGAITDINGNYQISNVDANAILVFSFIGMRIQEVAVGNRSTIDIILLKDEQLLDEVVVVGYASVERKDLTGAISSVNAKQIKDFPLASAAEALQGRLAGVQATSLDGTPGADIIIRVRGGGSITQDNSPLYIVDGVQVENALSVLAPQDIANIDVLKDASSTAIYGARAANGVVIITTKAGKPGKTQVTYNVTYGRRELPKTLDVLSPYDYVVWNYERTRGSVADSTRFANTYGTTWDTLNAYKDIPAVNWQEQVFGRKAQFQNHNLSLSGGNANTTYNLSLTGNKEQGLLLQTGFERYIVNFKLDHKINNKAKTGFTARYLEQRIFGAGTSNPNNIQNSTNSNRLRSTIFYRPFLNPKSNLDIDDFDEDFYNASGGDGGLALLNPILQTEAEYRKQSSNATFLTGYFSYNILKNLTFRSTFGYDNSVGKNERFFNKLSGNARNNGSSLPIALVANAFGRTFNNSNTLQYSVKGLKKKHDITILAGHEIVDRNENRSEFQVRLLPADISAEKALSNMGLGVAFNGTPRTSYEPPSRIFSLFGRATYGYKDLYLFSFNLRNDRSSKFSPDNGSLLFPSGSVAWRFSNEKFIKDTKWLSDGKIRAGFGVVGNNRIRNLAYTQLYNTSGQYAVDRSVLFGLAPTALSNPNLSWEQNKTINLGLDLGLFNNKLQLTVDVYKNSANDLLLDALIPPTTGYTSQLQNLGGTSNRGIEFQLSSTPVANKNFTWNSSFNVSFNRNRVENLGGLTQIIRNSNSVTQNDFLVRVGESVGLMYGYMSDGFYKVDEFDYNPTTLTYTLKPGVPVMTLNVSNPIRPGHMKWKDISGADGKPDGRIDINDRTVIGNANPDFIGGWNNQFTYKNFDFSVFVNFVVGNDIYNGNKLEWVRSSSNADVNMLSLMKDRFTYINASGQRVTDPTELAALNANAKIWTPDRNSGNNAFPHSWAIEDGTYLRINTATFGYTLPKNLLNKVKISNFRIFGTVNNLYNFTNYTGFDPDVTSRQSDPLTPGVDYGAFPRSRTWVMGANVTF